MARRLHCPKHTLTLESNVFRTAFLFVLASVSTNAFAFEMQTLEIHSYAYSSSSSSWVSSNPISNPGGDDVDVFSNSFGNGDDCSSSSYLDWRDAPPTQSATPLPSSWDGDVMNEVFAAMPVTSGVSGTLCDVMGPMFSPTCTTEYWEEPLWPASEEGGVDMTIGSGDYYDF